MSDDNFEYDWTQFQCKIFINCSMAQAYNAWKNEENITKWFLRSAKYKNKDGSSLAPSEEIQKNCSYKWAWHGYDIVEEGEILLANGQNQLSFTFAGDCVVDVKLTPYKDKTLLTLVQKNIPTDEKSKVNIHMGCRLGWSFHITNLKSLLEGGLNLLEKSRENHQVVNA